MRAYRLKADADNSDAVAGTIVYDCVLHDYGLAEDDSHAFGKRHKSVTLLRAGTYPCFTIPEEDLEPIEMPPIDPLTERHVMSVCRPGAGAETCRYLTMGPGGWCCEHVTALKQTIDFRVEQMTAKAVNCDGRGPLRADA